MNSGIIGFFDILGYQSFLKNNRDEGACQVVTNLVNLQQSLGDEMREAFSHYQEPPKVDEMIGLLRWLVFSDTIMVYSEYCDDDSSAIRTNRWIVMNFACLLLWRRMFEFGLPLRGVIHTGDFLVEEACFAGEAIVDAYHLSQDFDLATVAYSHDAFSALVTHANAPHDPLIWNWIPAQLFEYLVPRKTGRPERLCVINPLTLILEDSGRFRSEAIRQLVLESFLGHNKDVPETARSKLDHTEDYLRASIFVLSHPTESAARMSRWERKPEGSALE